MNKKVFIAIGIFWLAIILVFIALKEFTLKTGEEVLLKTIPVDPRDLFRGDYVILSYDISRLNINEFQTDAANFSENDKVYVALNKEGNYGAVTGIYKEQPKTGLFLKGEVTKVDNKQISVKYGIESYFVPEGKGWDIQRQAGSGLEVKVIIDKFGNAVIDSLILDGNKVRFD